LDLSLKKKNYWWYWFYYFQKFQAVRISVRKDQWARHFCLWWIFRGRNH
jgi:hypothetical protein